VNRFTRLLLTLAGLALFAVLVWQSDPAALLKGLRSSWWVVTLLIPLWAVVYFCNAMAWRLLVSEGTSLPGFRAWVITVMAFGVNYATPFLSFGGEPLKAIAAARWLGPQRAVGSVIAFRLLHSLSHMLVFTAVLIPAAILLPHTPLTFIGLGLCAAIFLLIIWFLVGRHSEGVFIGFLALLRRTPGLRKLAPKLESRVASFHALDAEVTAIRTQSPQRFYLALAFELVGRILSLAEFILIVYALGLGFEPVRAFVAGSLGSLVLMLFLFIPFELGSKEGGLYLAFSLVGYPPALGLQASLLSRLRELSYGGLGILLIWTMGDSPFKVLGRAMPTLEE
jgi:hypothetical protein